MQQTFLAEKEMRIHLLKVRGDLQIQGWDQREVRLEWDDQRSNLVQEGTLLQLSNCASDVQVWAPYDAEVRVESLGGDATAQDLRRVELKDVRGKVDLRNIGVDVNLEYIGEAILLTEIGHDVKIQRASSLRARRKLGGDVRLERVRLVEIEAVKADLDLQQVEMASIGSVGSDLKALGVGDALRCGNVGGDCQIGGSEGADILLGNVGGDLRIDGAVKVHVGNAGSDAEVRHVREKVEVGNIGGDATITGVGGSLTLGQVGADARLLDLGGSTHVGGVGGDLELQSAFVPESKTHLHVGGDASVSLPVEANLALQATVGGAINGPSVNFERHGNLVRLVYGEGQAQLTMSVGGDIQLRGGGTPRVNSASMPWGEFSQEMADLSQSMAQLGRDLGQTFSEMFSELGRAHYGQEFAHMFDEFQWKTFDQPSRKVEEQMRRAREKAEQHARHAAERARKIEARARRHEYARRPADRMYVRINEREWQMNPDRLNDLVNRAQEAAMEGVAGALEAVERAVSNLRMQYATSAQQPPMPPTPPMPPSSPVSPTPPTPPEAPAGFGSGPVPPAPPTFPFTANEAESSENAQNGEDGPNLEAEREAILRMIAEGRITPEEGDMLLEGLGN